MVEKEFTPRTVKPDPMLKDLAGRQMPAIKGYVSTELKPHATLDTFIDRANTRTPLIASWRYGAGKAMAVTTDASGRWSSPWVQDGIFRPALEQGARLDDARDRRHRAEVRRRARLPRRPHPYEAHRL